MITRYHDHDHQVSWPWSPGIVTMSTKYHHHKHQPWASGIITMITRYHHHDDQLSSLWIFFFKIRRKKEKEKVSSPWAPCIITISTRYHQYDPQVLSPWPPGIITMTTRYHRQQHDPHHPQAGGPGGEAGGGGAGDQEAARHLRPAVWDGGPHLPTPASQHHLWEGLRVPSLLRGMQPVGSWMLLVRYCQFLQEFLY